MGDTTFIGGPWPIRLHQNVPKIHKCKNCCCANRTLLAGPHHQHSVRLTNAGAILASEPAEGAVAAAVAIGTAGGRKSSDEW